MLPRLWSFSHLCRSIGFVRESEDGRIITEGRSGDITQPGSAKAPHLLLARPAAASRRDGFAPSCALVAAATLPAGFTFRRGRTAAQTHPHDALGHTTYTASFKKRKQ